MTANGEQVSRWLDELSEQAGRPESGAQKDRGAKSWPESANYH